MQKTTTYTCSRCNGTGKYSFNLMHGTKCYGCNGTGQQNTKPRAPTPKWAIFGQHKATGEWMRLYNCLAKTKAQAIESGQATYAKSNQDWRATYSMDEPRAIKWSDTADQQALTWEQAATTKAAA